jgi:transposase, IS30 family
MSYQHLTEKERYYAEQRLEQGDSIPWIAKSLGRHKSTLYRELKRNTDESMGFYSHRRAHTLARSRLTNTLRKKSRLDQLDEMTKSFIQSGLLVRMSPEQLSESLKLEGIGISHQTIYRHIWANRRNGGTLYESLRRRGKKYQGRNAASSVIEGKVSIAQRSPVECLRKESGHYEIDTIFGLEQRSFLLTLVDLATRYTVIIKLPNKEAETVCCAIGKMMATTLLPFKTLTSDNGSEFARHAQIAQEYGINWYFCDPYSSWQRGLNENTNGLIRDFYPKRTDFRDISEEDISNVQNILNNRPRKVLNFSTPVRAMVKQMEG